MSKTKKNKKRVVPNKLRSRVFNYTSVCCDAPANKPPVERSAEDRAEGKFSECHLGKWHCSKCGKACKVKRSRIKEDKQVDGTNSESGTAEGTNA